MRPRLLHLGYPGRLEGLLCHGDHASMRPRLLHLGYSTSRVVFSFPFDASMRPRLLHLGYKNSGKYHHPKSLRFNEAEAFTPRILCDTFALVPCTWASMRPRLLHLGYGIAASACAIPWPASMRPRLLHLGYEFTTGV